DGWVNSAAVLEESRRAAARGHAPNQLWYLFVLETWLRRERDAGDFADEGADGGGARKAETCQVG
ncbi:MAG TPA: hypothetical protein VER32_15255, partial [Pyrinomonadaceae bacterium]|nr:hypothetical protein [Pyrinomonadaceae bacterium]